MSNKRGPTAGTEEAKRGGQTVREKYGSAFIAQIGKKGGETMKQRGPAYFADIGRKGGESTKQKHGSELYARAGKAGGAAKKHRQMERPST